MEKVCPKSSASQDISFKIKNTLLHLNVSTTKKHTQCLKISSGFEAIIFQWDIPVEILVQPSKEGFQLCMGPRVAKGYAAGPGWVQTFLVLGPHNLADHILLDESWLGKMLWGLTASPSRKITTQTPRVWSRLSAEDDCSPFEKQLVVCYWVLIKTNVCHGTLRDFVARTAHHEQVFGKPAKHQGWWAQQEPTVGREWRLWEQAREG